jgi:hypothetical protein
MGTYIKRIAILMLIIYAIPLLAVSILFVRLKAEIQLINEAYSQGSLIFLEEIRSKIENFTKIGLNISLKWFEWLKWIILIGTISIISAETKNQIIQAMVNLSYFMIFLALFSDATKFFSIVYLEKHVEKAKNWFNNDEEMSRFFKYLSLFLYLLALISSIAITILLSRFIYYLVPIIQNALS